MAEQPEKLVISPRAIVTGTGVIQLAHVTSVGYAITHPFRPLGIGLIGMSLALVGAELVRSGAAAFALKAGGSLLLWLGFGAAGIGLFLSVFAQRALVVRTVDGARTRLPARDEEAASAIVERIRDAIEASVPAAPARAAELPAHGAPISLPAQDASPPRTTPPRSLPAGLPHTAPPRELPEVASHAMTQPIARRTEGYVNGHPAGPGPETGYPGALPAGAGGRRSLAEHLPPRTQPDQVPFSTGSLGLRTGEAGHGGGLEQRLQQVQREPREPLALPAAAPLPIPRDDPVQDLHQLMEHVRHADVQHKEALLELLRVVDDHYMGRASREDAVAHWRSFSDYVHQYLGGVDGLLGQTDRFGRHMSQR